MVWYFLWCGSESSVDVIFSLEEFSLNFSKLSLGLTHFTDSLSHSEALILSNLSGFWINASSRYLGLSKYISLSFTLCRFLLFSSRSSPGACGLSLSAPYGSGRERRSTGRPMLQNWTELMTKKVGEGGSKGLERETRGSSIKSQKRTDREEEDELLGVQNGH